MKEVIVIGGGIVGMCTAWHLHQAGFDVTIVRANASHPVCSDGNAGMIVPSHFIPLASPGMMAKGLQWMFQSKSPFYIRPRINMELIQWMWQFLKASTPKHVIACAPLLRDWHAESREWYQKWNETRGEIDFQQRGILMLYQSAHAEKDELSTAAFATDLGIEANVLTASDLQKMDPHTMYNVLGAVHYPGDAHFDPARMLQSIEHQLKSGGVHVYDDVTIDRVRDDKSSFIAVTSKGDIMTARYGVIAAGVWSGQLLQRSGFKMPMQDGKGYSMTMATPSGVSSIPSILHEARVAVSPFGDRWRISGTLEISGMDDKVRETKIKGVSEAISRYYPDVSMPADLLPWFGYRPCAPDGMPYIGKLTPDSSILAATGHAMMGVSLAPATARLITEAIQSEVRMPKLVQPLRFAT